MTEKEKIRAELIRLKDKYYKRGEESDALQDGYAMYWGGVISTFNELITFVDSLPEEPVSEDLEKAADNYASGYKQVGYDEDELLSVSDAFIDGAKWQKEHLWHDAQGNDLPEIDREVIALQGRKVVFAHRPNPNGWDGKSLSTGKVEHFEPKTYDKGGWNIPDVRYWLDAPLPEGIE